ncbi:FAD-binding oxidoreductase [Limobrevibacterium gyesilva]|uniref:FAD-binding oxidoreductase n=1 Tax=Limobrevibacterium gyesilva TaxID=2991712 RepID=A0AA41YJL5_9PROT|nr:FAD-binding oxidoreductase [Limobrevibacterium gyesilva]MCW3473501.1 FAD-binding oxidoreductase [Limobrevibacterium gyesilva]
MDTSISVLAELRGAIGADSVMAGDAMEAKHFADWVVKAAEGAGPIAVAYPRSTADVSAILRVCHAHRIPVVPQGGLTGLVGGATPVAGCIALSLSRMRAVEEVDAAAATITVQAGVPLQVVQEAADAAGLLFPLDIGSRGSCVIGGNVSTNAGGNRVLRYGMTRELVLGIEVVLADGTVMTSLNKMLKNNAGYDLKHLFIGSEGTLGVVTRLVLRLFPKPESVCTAFCALPDYAAVLELLRRARGKLGGALSAFEVIWPEFYKLATTEHGVRPPVGAAAGVYVLMDSLGSDQEQDTAIFSALIEAALEDGVVDDAVIAQSYRESREFWSLRDSVAEFQRTFDPHVGFDVSVPIGRMQEFIDDCRAHLVARYAPVRALWFGHIADSNLHICVKQEPDGPTKKEIDQIVYGRVRAFGGSVSAEHGIGLLKKPYLEYSRSPVELDVMRRVKAALDPEGILNPGKVF